jgi:hypothetical protein
MNFFSYCLSGKDFTLPSFLMDNFSGYSIPGEQVFSFFSSLHVISHSLLAYDVYDNKIADNLVGLFFLLLFENHLWLCLLTV